MEKYNWAQERYREKSRECIEKQLKYGKYCPPKLQATLTEMLQVANQYSLAMGIL